MQTEDNKERLLSFEEIREEAGLYKSLNANYYILITNGCAPPITETSYTEGCVYNGMVYIYGPELDEEGGFIGAPNTEPVYGGAVGFFTKCSNFLGVRVVLDCRIKKEE